MLQTLTIIIETDSRDGEAASAEGTSIMSLPTIHPGRTLLGELLERNWTLTELAAKLGEDPSHVRDFLMEYADVTPELARKVAALIGTSEAFWLNMQARYDAAQPHEAVKAE